MLKWTNTFLFQLLTNIFNNKNLNAPTLMTQAVLLMMTSMFKSVPSTIQLTCQDSVDTTPT